MATSSVTSSSTTSKPVTTSADIAAANRTAAQRLISTLNAGSGVDVASLAQNLVDAERTPRENEINGKISKNEARISGYSAIKFMFSELKNAFSALKDKNSFNTLTANNTNPDAFNVTASSSASSGVRQVEVNRLARAQRTVSDGLPSASAPINGGTALKINLAINPLNITPSLSINQGAFAVTETSQVTFKGLAANESVTVDGLKLVASAPMTADEVATAFSSLASGATPINPPKGVFVGTLSGFSASASNGNTVLFTSNTTAAPVPDITVSSDAQAGVPNFVTTQGVTPATETAAVTFKDMTAGQSVTIGGLTFTSKNAMTASQVASAFSNVASGTTPANIDSGSFSGVLSGFSAGVASGTSVTFTSDTLNANVGDLTVSAATKQIDVPAGKDTPQGIVDAINASGLNLTAELVNTGNGSATPFQIVITGGTGVANAFSVNLDYGSGSASPGLSFSQNNPANQAATDALFKVDGISYVRSTNSISDAVTGLAFELKNTTTGAATISLTRDTSSIKDKMKALVSAYKDANDILTEVANPDSTLDTYGKTLVGDSTVRSLKLQLRSMFSGSSSTPGASVGSLWQMGFKIDEKGNMTLDETKLDTVLLTNYDDVVKSFTGGYNNVGTYSSLSAGFAGDAFKKLDKLTSTTGVIVTNSDNATKLNDKYKKDLEQLKTRMDKLLERYTKQFSAMDSLVGQVNSQKTSLKSTFDGMMAAYTNK